MKSKEKKNTEKDESGSAKSSKKILDELRKDVSSQAAVGIIEYTMEKSLSSTLSFNKKLASKIEGNKMASNLFKESGKNKS